MSQNNERQYRALDAGLRAHYFLRMTSKDRFGDLDRFECACGLEFEDTEQLREHQNLHLRIFLGIAEEVGNKS